MNLIAKIALGTGIAAGIGAATLLSPVIPSNTHTFTASGQGCSIAKDEPKSLVSILRQRDTSFEGQDNVVRILRYDGDTTHFGTGYAVGNYILTAAHVVDGKSDGPVQILFQENNRPGTVLASNAVTDVALVGLINPLILYDPSIKSVKIGDIAKGDKATVKTLDPRDVEYYGGSESHRTLNQTRYQGVAVPEDQIREMRSRQQQLAAQSAQIQNEIDALLAPYYGQRKADTTTAAPRFLKIPPLSDSYYYFRGETEADKMVGGVSGSPLFKGNKLVGIASGNTIRGHPGSMTTYVNAFSPMIPKEILEAEDALDNAKNVIDDRIGELDSEIFDLQNPELDRFASPHSIIELLQGACKSTPSSLQHLGNAKAYWQAVVRGFSEAPKKLYLQGMKR